MVVGDKERRACDSQQDANKLPGIRAELLVAISCFEPPPRMSSRKRKHRGQHPDRTRGRFEEEDGGWDEPEQHWQRPAEHEYDPALHIVAHEADIERGPGAARMADSLEARMTNQPGSRLIRLGWEALGGKDVWVDRYVDAFNRPLMYYLYGQQYE